MKRISVLKKGEYDREEGDNVLHPKNIRGSFVFVCCVCGETYFHPDGCKGGIYTGRGIFVDEDFYVFVDVLDSELSEGHIKCAEMFKYNPMAYMV